MSNVAQIGAPLSSKLKKDDSNHFEALATKMLKAGSAPIFALPGARGSYTLDTDVCNAKNGCLF